MSDTEKSASPDGTPAAKKKGGKGKLLMIVGASVVVLGTGGIPPTGSSPAAGDGAAAGSQAAAHGIVNFEPFIVNLADTGRGVSCASRSA
jgi:flagellar basal body-associated protein FliL